MVYWTFQWSNDFDQIFLVLFRHIDPTAIDFIKVFPDFHSIPGHGYHLMSDNLSQQAQDAIAGANEVLDRLRAAFALSTRNNSELVFYTRSRVKDPSSLVAKLFDRQQRYAGKYNITDVTDIVGYRIVVLYDDQLGDALRLVMTVLRNCYHTDDKLIDSRNVWENIHEVKMFPRRNRQDDPYVSLHNQFCLEHPDVAGTKIKLVDASDSDYSSMHIIIYLNSYSLGSKKRVPVEIQIRTAIEDVWSEISHKNKYKVRRPNVWSPDLAKLYDDNDNRVNIVKQHFDSGLPSQISDIRKTTDKILEQIHHISSNQTSGYQSTVTNLIFQIGVSEIGPKLRRAIDTYDSQLRSFRSRNSLRGAEALARQLRTIRDLTTSVGDTQLRANVESLLNFEIARVEALSIRQELMRLKARRKLTDEVRENREITLKERAFRAYTAIDDFQRNENALLKSISLCEFWKFYLCRYSDAANHSTSHLISCQSSLIVDPLINSSHVLHYMVPRLLAYDNWEAAEAERETLLKLDVKAGNIIQSMRRKYADSLKFSLASDQKLHSVSIDRSNNDLIHFRSRWDKYISLNNVVQYSSDCLNNGVGEYFFSEIGYGFDQFERDVEKLRTMAERVKVDHQCDFKHTLLIGLDTANRTAEAKKIAQELRSHSDWDQLPYRLKDDVFKVVG